MLDDHFNAMRSEKDWNDFINKYKSDIILARKNLISKKMIDANLKWIYIYSDSISIIFIKNEECHGDIFGKIKKKKLVYPKRRLSIFFP